VLAVRSHPLAPPVAGLAEAVQPWAPLVRVAEIASAAEEPGASRFAAVFGDAGGVFLTRPDGYLGLAAGEHAGAARLQGYCQSWLLAGRGD